MKNYILLSAILLMGQNLYAEGILSVSTLNQKLQKTHAGWTARETSMSHLSKAEARLRMGLRRQANADTEFVAPPTLIKSALPSALDWRNKDGKNWVSPILDQGACGSCVAFASIGVMETQYKISSAIPTFTIKLSPQNLFSCGGGACNWGWQPDGAASYLQSSGVPDEACMPYTSGASGQDVACESSCADTNRRSIRIASYASPSRSVRDAESVKQALQKGPVVTTLSVYEDFMSYSTGIYKHVTGDVLGGHAVSIVGYDDNERYYIVRNSWGTGWGENGFIRVSYDDISGIGDETWSYDIPSIAGGVSVNAPIDYSYYTGKGPMSVFSSYGSTDSLSVALYNAKNQAVWSGTCATSSCAQDLNVGTLPDGRYEIDATALNSTGAKIGNSSRHFFYVANHEPKLALSFAPKGFDLSKDLQARVEFTVSASSSTVPMNDLEFHVRSADGKETVRKASVVLDQMTIGWRTNLVPNGTYEIWLVGKVVTNTQETAVESKHEIVHTKN